MALSSCMHAGIVNIYGLIQLTLPSVFHSFGLFWSIVFPFHYRRFKLEKKIKYVHITTLVLVLALPVFPALLHLIDGYSVGLGPFYTCIGRNTVVTYFTFILPISIILAIATSLMIIIFWTIFKVYMGNIIILYHNNNYCCCYYII